MNNAGCSRRSPLQQWNELLRHAGHPLLEVEAAQRRLTTWQPPGSWQHNRNPMIRYQGSASRARLVAEHRGFHRCVHTVCQSTRAALPRP
ncbi:uncharacterized protein LOC125239566 isoform X5 [Leguminivora glycinivorella]|uniref:uncharacterized protein LOC125239566 isoform X5 n=1 Tax=Leguminivora glycinivorella TaxID=1035111 RepID=UPI00200F8B12|nr:uncharacterized protein LOC125239566 isoform X5 [Leguminivora glycinivorella]